MFRICQEQSSEAGKIIQNLVFVKKTQTTQSSMSEQKNLILKKKMKNLLGNQLLISQKFLLITRKDNNFWYCSRKW